MTGKKEINKEIVTVPNYVVEFGQAKENGKYIWIVTKARIQGDTIKPVGVRAGAVTKLIIKELNKLRRATE
tara:strand:- start:1025 stop:1237 length:213 start_codon:yes stop_codon:yes gene_type:complete